MQSIRLKWKYEDLTNLQAYDKYAFAYVHIQVHVLAVFELECICVSYLYIFLENYWIL